MFKKGFITLLGIVLWGVVPAQAIIKTNIQTDFNAIHDDGNNSVSVGEYKLFYRAQTTDDMILLTEMVYRQNPTSLLNQDVVDERFDIERLFIIYNLSPNFQFTIGRFHTNISHWNTAYERGVYFEPSILRPLVSESNYIPIDYAGVDLRIDGDVLGLKNSVLNVGVGSSHRIYSMQVLNAFYNQNFSALRESGETSDLNPNILNGSRVVPNPNQVSPHIKFTQNDFMMTGLSVGTGAYQNYINTNFSQYIFTGHVAYMPYYSDYELIAEAMFINNDVPNTVSVNDFKGGHITLAKKFYWPFLNESQKLYGRVDAVSSHLNILNKRYQYTAGINVDINEVANAKFEVRVLDIVNTTGDKVVIAFQNSIYY